MYVLTSDAHILNDKSHAERWDKVWNEKEMGMKAGVSSGDEAPKSEVPFEVCQWRRRLKSKPVERTS